MYSSTAATRLCSNIIYNTIRPNNRTLLQQHVTKSYSIAQKSNISIFNSNSTTLPNNTSTSNITTSTIQQSTLNTRLANNNNILVSQYNDELTCVEADDDGGMCTKQLQYVAQLTK